MKNKRNYGRWQVSEKDTVNLTPLKVRQIMLKCLLSAQKETFEKALTSEENKPTDKEIENRMNSVMKTIFRESNVDYESPTKAGLRNVAKKLSYLATGWQTPKDIIIFHLKQINQLIDALE